MLLRGLSLSKMNCVHIMIRIRIETDYRIPESRRHRHLKKISVFFFLTPRTDYVIRHISKYSNICHHCYQILLDFVQTLLSDRHQKPQGLCAVGFLHQSCFGLIEKGKQGSIFLHFHVLVSCPKLFQRIPRYQGRARCSDN